MDSLQIEVRSVPVATPAGSGLHILLAVRAFADVFALLVTLVGLQGLQWAEHRGAIHGTGGLQRVLLVAIGTAVFDLFAIGGTWTKKRWGVLGLVSSTLLALAMAARDGGTLGALLHLGVLALIVYKVAPSWREYE
jgi:hypothetical protein